MHQRHPIRIDKGRAFSAKTGPVSTSTQVAFHKIYRKKRRYSLVDKEQEGHTGSQWKAGFVNPQRDDNAGLRCNYSSGSSSLKPIRRIDHDNAGLRSHYSSGSSSHKPIRRFDSIQRNSPSSYSVSPPNRERDGKGYGQHSKGPNDRLGYVSGSEFDEPNNSSSYSVSPPPNRESGKGYWQHPKRPNDRLAGCNSVSGSEFDEPFVKKQKVESHKYPALHQHVVSPETEHDKQKLALDDTKWMYKNQYAKMSGPYSVKQLMEGFYSRFLLEDLPVYQLVEGKLCKPMMLKQLIDDVERCNLRLHNPGRHFDHSFSEESFRQVAPKGMPTPCKIVKDMDLPPGFGGHSAPLSERPSCMQMPNATASAAGPKRSIGAFSSSLPDFGVAEFGLPPGFEAVAGTTALTEPHITELSGSSRRLSTGAGVPVRSEGAQGMQLSYEKFEPVVHGRGHASHQGSSPHSKVSYTMQGAKSLSDNSMQLEPIAHDEGHISQQGSSPHSKVSYTKSLSDNSMQLEPIVHGRGHLSQQSSSPHSKVRYTKSLSDNSMQLEPIVHGRGHISQQGSSPPSVMNFTLQGARSLNENSRRHTTWGFASPNTRVSSIESQTFSSPTVCIGLPVSKPAVQSWPVVNNLPMAYAQANNGLVPTEYFDNLPIGYAQANNGLVPTTEYSEFSVRHDLDPLVIIRLELLAAVKRSYVKTILSALIDEQLKCWIDGKDTMVKSSLAEDGSSHSREASSLSSAEVGVMSVESNTLQTDVSTAPATHHIGSAEPSLQMRPDGSCLNAHVGSAETFLEMRAAQSLDGSGLINQYAHIAEHQCPSAEALNTRNDGDTHTSFVLADVRSMSGTEENSLGTSKVPFVRKSLELHHDVDKAESSLSNDALKLCVKSSSSMGNSFDNSKLVVVSHREEVPRQSGDEILQGDGAVVEKVQPSGNTTDAVLLETEPSFLVSGRKNLNVKSLKHLLQITSKRHSKLSSSMYKKEKTSRRTAPEAGEGRLRNGVLILKDYDGCARTSVDGWLWRKLGRHAPHSKGFQLRHCSFLCIQLHAHTARTHRTQLRKLSAAADGSSNSKRTQSEAKLKLARSKIHEWGVFAVEPVEPGAFVMEYVGEVVRPRISDIREQHYKKVGIGNSYLFRVDDEMVVDATKRGGLARFMNYSCDPNCCARIVTVGGSKKVYIYAKRLITAGEELTYDCKSQLEDQMIPCNCGSTRCRGLMHSNDS